VFDRIDREALTAVTSPITLAECLVVPIRLRKTKLARDFGDLIVHGGNTIFVPIEQNAAARAAELRARYNLSLTDSLQVAGALMAGCDSFLTNDRHLVRVRELHVLVLEDCIAQAQASAQ